MSTAARKARKKAGVKFVHTPKVGTPIQQRIWFREMLPGVIGTKFQGRMVRRSAKKRTRALKDRGIE